MQHTFFFNKDVNRTWKIWNLQTFFGQPEICAMDCRAARERARGWGPRLLLRSLPMIPSPYRKIQKILLLYEKLLQRNSVHQTEFEKPSSKTVHWSFQGLSLPGVKSTFQQCCPHCEKNIFLFRNNQTTIALRRPIIFCHHRNPNCAGCHGSASTSFSTILSR